MFDLDPYLRLRASWAEDLLRAALPPEGTRPARLTEALRYSVLTGGKRLRPILTGAAAEAAGGRLEDAGPAAVAVEFLHAYTLVHDDLPCMDNDLLRRGQPTVHARFGETLAVLAGDALQAMAFGVLGTARLPPDTIRQLVMELAAAAGPAGVVGGQVEDILHGEPTDADRVTFVHRHKTADLFAAALRMGGLSGGGNEETVAALGRFGEHLGLAFQIVDDLLDAGGEPDDPAAPELSCLSVWSPSEAEGEAARHTAAAIAALRALPGPVAPLEALAGRLRVRTV